MNIIEYGYYDIASNELETKNNIIQALQFDPCVISVLPYYLKPIRLEVSNKAKLSCVIDYPFGISDFDARYKCIENAIKSGADIVEVVCPSNLLCNRKYDKFRKEIDLLVKLSYHHDVELRYILEYKIFTLELLYKVTNILAEYKIFTIYPSANFLMNDISDNILVAMLLHKKNPAMNIIVNGGAWTDDQIALLFNNNQIYGYKTSNIHTLEKIYKKSHN